MGVAAFIFLKLAVLFEGREIRSDLLKDRTCSQYSGSLVSMIQMTVLMI